MRISNDPNFVGAVWEQFSSERSWTLGTMSGPALVYVEFRDAAGNISPVASDAIMMQGNKIYLPLVLKPAS